MVETPSHALLQEILPEGLAKPDDIPAEIFDYALGLFLEGRRLDMRAMARDLRIGRATLYRRVEGKAHLLDGVIWWLTRHLIVHALSEGSRRRAPLKRVLGVVETLLRDVNASLPLRRFLDEEPEAALRILTSKEGRVQSGLVEALARLLERERAGGLVLGIDPRTLAYAIVRIGESFLYADVIADSEPDIDQAMEVVERLLRAG